MSGRNIRSDGPRTRSQSRPGEVPDLTVANENLDRANRIRRRRFRKTKTKSVPREEPPEQVQPQEDRRAAKTRDVLASYQRVAEARPGILPFRYVPEFTGLWAFLKEHREELLALAQENDEPVTIGAYSIDPFTFMATFDPLVMDKLVFINYDKEDVHLISGTVAEEAELGPDQAPVRRYVVRFVDHNDFFVNAVNYSRASQAQIEAIEKLCFQVGDLTQQAKPVEEYLHTQPQNLAPEGEGLFRPAYLVRWIQARNFTPEDNRTIPQWGTLVYEGVIFRDLNKECLAVVLSFYDEPEGPKIYLQYQLMGDQWTATDGNYALYAGPVLQRENVQLLQRVSQTNQIIGIADLGYTSREDFDIDVDKTEPPFWFKEQQLLQGQVPEEPEGPVELEFEVAPAVQELDVEPLELINQLQNIVLLPDDELIDPFLPEDQGPTEPGSPGSPGSPPEINIPEPGSPGPGPAIDQMFRPGVLATFGLSGEQLNLLDQYRKRFGWTEEARTMMDLQLQNQVPYPLAGTNKSKVPQSAFRLPSGKAPVKMAKSSIPMGLPMQIRAKNIFKGPE